MKENVIRIKSGVTININASVKSIIYLQKIISVIPPHVVLKWKTFSKYYGRFSDNM